MSRYPLSQITKSILNNTNSHTYNRVYPTDHGPNPRRCSPAFTKRLQQLHLEDAERVDDAIKGDIAKEGGDEHDPRPALVRHDWLLFSFGGHFWVNSVCCGCGAVICFW